MVKRLEDETPAKGEYLYDYKIEILKEELSKLSPEEMKKKVKIKFSDLPISTHTSKGLFRKNFNVMTEI